MLRRVFANSNRISSSLLRSVVHESRVQLESADATPTKSKKRKKIRLDEYLIQQYPEHSVKSLKAWILRRKVRVNDHTIDKPATLIMDGQKVCLDVEDAKYVSRAGYKMEAALREFQISVRNKCCLDSGIGTGGFTDCLLQNGARKVYGVDVGYGDVDYRLRTNPKVQLLERTNLRYLDHTSIEDPIDLVTLDLSFISVLKVIPVIAEVLEAQGDLIVLIKPQFEAKKEDVDQGGVVTNLEVHEEIIHRIQQGIEKEGFTCVRIIPSPLKGKDSENIEKKLAKLSGTYGEATSVPTVPTLREGPALLLMDGWDGALHDQEYVDVVKV